MTHQYSVQTSLQNIPMWHIPNRIVYVVNRLLFYKDNEYAYHTHCFAKNLVEQGYSIVVLNQASQSLISSDFKNRDISILQEREGIRYFFLKEPILNQISEKIWLNESEKILKEAFMRFKPSFIIATSDWKNGLPALKAAQALKIPFFYDFFEVQETDNNSIKENKSSINKQISIYEKDEVVNNSDHLFIYNKNIKDELIKKGIESNKISLISINKEKNKINFLSDLLDISNPLLKNTNKDNKLPDSLKVKDILSIEVEKEINQYKIKNTPLSKLIDPKKIERAVKGERLRVAAIMDEFTYAAYSYECELYQLTPQNVLEELESIDPDFLFVESAWQGKDQLWNKKISNSSEELNTAIAWCEEHNIPTAFWNKEDPVHFEVFLKVAHKFDFIFTTDIDCISRYKEALSHNRVYLLPFACQPVINNPIEILPRKPAFSFAGSYYCKYPERIKDLENFVQALPQFAPLDIYDRNYGKGNQAYLFPSSYLPLIVGSLPFEEIHKAYKGYLYSVNMNTIKQSQSMFARRVYELLASNTITVSNYSKGLRSIFGDLVISSDNGNEIVKRLKHLSKNQNYVEKYRLSGLRKVLLEHTYKHRFIYLIQKIFDNKIAIDIYPSVAVISYSNKINEQQYLIDQFCRQKYTNCCFILITDIDTYRPLFIPQSHSKKIFIKQRKDFTCTDLEYNSAIWLAPIFSDDYYGEYYLTDLVLASSYTNAKVIGKGSFFSVSNGKIQKNNEKNKYCEVEELAVRSSIIQRSCIKISILQAWFPLFSSAIFSKNQFGKCFSIDIFNYCRNASSFKNLKNLEKAITDIKINQGIPLNILIQKSESITPEPIKNKTEHFFSQIKLKNMFSCLKGKKVYLEFIKNVLRIYSQLSATKHEYIYATEYISIDQMSIEKKLESHLVTTTGLDLQYVFEFLDKEKKKIGHIIHKVNTNYTDDLPEGTYWIRFGLRCQGTGQADISCLLFEHKKVLSNTNITQNKYLIISNNYPSYDNIYAYMFVHSRVLGYIKRGIYCDVFKFVQKQTITSYYEFENIDVITGSQNTLELLLKSGNYKTILIHVLTEPMWEILSKYINKFKYVIWIHGAEIQPYSRRSYNYTNDEEREHAKKQSQKRILFWKKILINPHKNIKFIFVSQYFANEVMEDLGIYLSKDSYFIIHNPINTKLFTYVPKNINQRNKILSIRPYTSATYANDLSIKTILYLSKKSFFKDLEIRIIGDGQLFEETVSPIKDLKNVILEKKFLTQEEISFLHKQYGIFLCPTRMDSQGVSRDEAMSSGLIPVTNNIAAIPEFVDDSCGILAPPEDAQAMADGITSLVKNPTLFLEMSKNAAQRVCRQSSAELIISKEIDTFL